MQGLVFRSLVPNPDLSITVTEPQKIGSGVNGYTVYKVQTTTTLAERFPSRLARFACASTLQVLICNAATIAFIVRVPGSP